MSWSDEPSYHPVTPLPARLPAPLPRPDGRTDPGPPPVPPPPPAIAETPALMVDAAAPEPRAVAPMGGPMGEPIGETITVPAPPPGPQLARERDLPSDDGLWRGDDLIAGRDAGDRPAPSTFGDRHLVDAPSWPSAQPRTSLVPTALPSRRPGTRGAWGWPDTGRWLAAALLAAVATLVTWQWLTPGSGSLEIRLADAERHPEVDVQVDGVGRCGTTPCLLDDVTAGSHLVEIGSRDGRVLRRRVDVIAGEHSLISLAFPPTRPLPIGQGVELRSELSPVKVSVDGERRGR